MHEACTTLPAWMQEANNLTPDPADGVTRRLQWRRVGLFASLRLPITQLLSSASTHFLEFGFRLLFFRFSLLDRD